MESQHLRLQGLPWALSDNLPQWEQDLLSCVCLQPFSHTHENFISAHSASPLPLPSKQEYYLCKMVSDVCLRLRAMPSQEHVPWAEKQRRNQKTNVVVPHAVNQGGEGARMQGEPHGKLVVWGGSGAWP